jgi:hypothetical protein
MSDLKGEPRLTVDLPVRIWGMSAEGRAFSQHARAHNISSEGALISGVESELKVGDVIGVQFEQKKTRCTVIWIVNTGPVKKNEVGIRLVALRTAGVFTATKSRCHWKFATSASTCRSASTPPM